MKNRISEYLKPRQLTMRQFAEIVGCSDMSMARYVRCEREPTLSMSRRIARALDADIDDVFPEDPND